MSRSPFLLFALLVALLWTPGRVCARDKEFMLMIPAGLDVGSSRHSREGKSMKVGAELSVVDLHWPSLGWFGGFAGIASVAGGLETSCGAELGIAFLGVDLGPVWRAAEAGSGWGWRGRMHVTWLFASFYVGVGEFESGSHILDLGFHFKPAWPLVLDMRKGDTGQALAAYEARGWTHH
jgi:hypothetical protein